MTSGTATERGREAAGRDRVVAALVGVARHRRGGALARERPAADRAAGRRRRRARALELARRRGDHHRVRAAPGQEIGGRSRSATPARTRAGSLLARTRSATSPGPYGGRLSDALTLLSRTSRRAAPREVFYGEVGGLERVALATCRAARRGPTASPSRSPTPGRAAPTTPTGAAPVRMDYEWRAEAIAPAATPTPRRRRRRSPRPAAPAAAPAPAVPSHRRRRLAPRSRSSSRTSA